VRSLSINRVAETLKSNLTCADSSSWTRTSDRHGPFQINPRPGRSWADCLPEPPCLTFMARTEVSATRSPFIIGLPLWRAAKTSSTRDDHALLSEAQGLASLYFGSAFSVSHGHDLGPCSRTLRHFSFREIPPFLHLGSLVTKTAKKTARHIGGWIWLRNQWTRSIFSWTYWLLVP